MSKKKKKIQRFKPENPLTLLYEIYEKKKTAQIRVENAPNTTVQILC